MKILHNAQLFAPGFQGATALAIDQGKILALGTDHEILTAFPHAQGVANLAGRTLWPGLTDAHVHLQHLAESRSMVYCETETLAECLEKVGTASQTLPPDAWIRGHGWNQNLWPEGFGTAAQLNAVSGGRPVYLTAKSLHAAWANTRALTLAGITALTPDPPGGVIQRDASGEPTGILLEGAAMALVEAAIPKLSQDALIAILKKLIPELWQMGLVGAHDFDGHDCFLATQSLSRQGDFPFHIRKNLPFDHLDDYIEAGYHTDQGDEAFQIGHVKLFADGALGPQTGAMLATYEDTNEIGTLLLSEAEILEIGKQAASHGLALAIHAIGDRANRVVLNALEQLRDYEQANGLPHFRHRIEHVQIISPEDLPRLAKLDIVASVQPVHAPSDMVMADRFLGSRASGAYAYASLKRSGATLVFGSDAPVEPVNPFHGIHAAVTRQRLNGDPGPEGWQPQERLLLEDALMGFSLTPARVANLGTQLGRIAPGYQADLILLEHDPFAMPPQALAELKPLATLIGGECVYRDPDLAVEF